MVSDVELIAGHGKFPTFRPGEAISGSQAAKVVIGAFVEVLAGYFLGAESWSADPFVCVGVHDTDLEREFELVPDLFWRQATTIVEVKGAHYGRRFHVHCDQLAAYEWSRDRASYPLYRPRALYALFGYRLPRSAGSYATVGELLADLVVGVGSGVYLDLAVVRHLADLYGCSGRWSGPLSNLLGSYKARSTSSGCTPSSRRSRIWPFPISTDHTLTSNQVASPAGPFFAEPSGVASRSPRHSCSGASTATGH